MSEPVAKFTTSAGSPAATARLWSPDAPYDSANETPDPAAVFCQSGMIASYALCGVE